MSLPPTHKDTAALCKLYHEVLTNLLDVIATSPLLHDPYVQESVAAARALLRAENPHAVALQRIDQTLQNHLYDLRDWVHDRLYGRPSTEYGYVPPDSEIQRILADIETLTHEGYALHAAVHQLRGEVPHA